MILFRREYKPMYEKLKRDEEERKEKEKTKQLERLRSDMKAETSSRGLDSFCIQFMISYSVFMIFVCSFCVLCSFCVHFFCVHDYSYSVFMISFHFKKVIENLFTAWL